MALFIYKALCLQYVSGDFEMHRLINAEAVRGKMKSLLNKNQIKINCMKKVLLVVLLVSAAAISFAQKARLNAYGNYVFPDGFDSYYDAHNYYNGTVNGSFQGGLGLEFMASERNCFEIMWQHQSTHAPTDYWDPNAIVNPKHTEFDLNVDYLMIGSDGHIQKPGSKVEGYGGLFLGCAFLGAKNPDNGNHNTATKFAWGARLGCNIWANEKFGIKLQAGLTSIAQGAGGGLYFGTGGVGAGVSTYSSIYQFTLGGGLSFKLGH